MIMNVTARGIAIESSHDVPPEPPTKDHIKIYSHKGIHSGVHSAIESTHRISSAYNGEGSERGDKNVREINESRILMQSPLADQQERRNSFLSLLRCWMWEFLGIMLSVTAIVAAAVTMLIYNQKSLEDWQFFISLNALVSILITTSKASLLFSVAACVSQAKWIHFRSSPRSLHHLELFDEASRGPWGATLLLRRFTAVPKLAILGALVTLFTLTMEPFAQQVIQTPLRHYSVRNESAASLQYVQVATILEGDADNTPLSLSIQEAILGSLNKTPLSVPLTCHSGNCTFSEFKGLELCSRCVNVTESARNNCSAEDSDPNFTFCAWRTPGNLTFTTEADSNGYYGLLYMSSCASSHYNDIGDDLYYGARFSVENCSKPVAGIRDPVLGSAIFRTNISEGLEQDYQPGTYDVHECAFYWCERTYTTASVSNGVIPARLDASSEIQLFQTPHSYLETYFNHNDADRYFYLSPNVSAIEPEGRVPKQSGKVNFPYAVQEYTPLRAFLFNLFDNSKYMYFVHDIDNAHLVEYSEQYVDAPNQLLNGPVYRASNMSLLWQNISSSVTNALPALRAPNVTGGFIYVSENYIHIQWAWFAPPLAIVWGGVTFFLLTIIMHDRYDTPLWKSSPLALLLHRLEIYGGHSDASDNGYEHKHQAAVARWKAKAPRRLDRHFYELSEGYTARLSYDADQNSKGIPGGNNGISIGSFVMTEKPEASSDMPWNTFRNRRRGSV